ncbi:MAG TPA: GTPase ObgE [Candidatus Woesebacteria bacterium]|nr:GTPase ObgE [Candidatus Woesebacteria bacterium]HPJ16902.1 GTPase ObgE [Candidatus Woesebacteria bacterium]
MLVDEVDITIKAGNGGDGIVHFYRDRWRPKGGPDGGDGGTGGSVYFKAVSDINRLYQFRHEKKFSAANGDRGQKNNCTGKNGQDLILELPVGSIINFDNGTSLELTTVGQTELVAKGGKGGVGNFRYRSSTNQQPQEFKPGFVTRPKNLHIALKLIADVGLVGLPNVGKSSLLNELTTAKAKVANFAFTTLEPNLGVMDDGRVMADIPGLIEGASEGKGLGFKFLKHIERTRILVHCLSCESTDPLADYQSVRQELAAYSASLTQKPEIIVITKADNLINDPKKLAKIVKLTKAKLSVSIIDPESLKSLKKIIQQALN